MAERIVINPFSYGEDGDRIVKDCRKAALSRGQSLSRWGLDVLKAAASKELKRRDGHSKG